MKNFEGGQAPPRPSPPLPPAAAWVAGTAEPRGEGTLDGHGAVRRDTARPSGLLVGAALAVGVVFALPLGYLLWRNLVLGVDVLAVLRSSVARGPLLRTLWLAITVSVACAILGTTLAWLTARTDLPARRLWRVLVPLPLVIPSFVGAAALVAGAAAGGFARIEGYPGAFAVLTLLSYPYVYLPVAARLASLPPSPEESARLLGRRPAEVFRTVVLPQVSGAVWAGTLLVFLYVISDFGAVQIVRYETLTEEIYDKRLNQPDVSVALSLLLGILAVAVVMAERRLARRRPVIDGVGARPPVRMGLGRWRAPALVVMASTVGLALVAPLATLAWWAVRGLVNGDEAAVSTATDAGELLRPALNTSLVGMATAVLAVLVVLPVAYLLVRQRSRLAELPNALVVGGFALPGLVVALSLGFLAVRLPEALGLYQSLTFLVLAYIVHFGAQAMRAAAVAVGAVPRRMDDAARMLGAGRTRRLFSVDLPLMRPGLVVGAGMVLLSTMKELPATLLLAPTSFDTLATRIWSANEAQYLAEMGLTAIVLVALSGVLTWVLVLRRSATLA